LHNAAIQDAIDQTYAPVAAAVTKLMDACAAGNSVRPVLEPVDVLLLMGYLWRVAPGEDGIRQGRRLAQIVLDGIRAGRAGGRPAWQGTAATPRRNPLSRFAERPGAAPPDPGAPSPGAALAGGSACLEPRNWLDSSEQQPPQDVRHCRRQPRPLAGEKGRCFPSRRRGASLALRRDGDVESGQQPQWRPVNRQDSHVAEQMVGRAAELARDSHARTRHAALLVKDGGLLAWGNNGVPFPGEDHCYCKFGDHGHHDLCRTHAEQRAITLARDGDGWQMLQGSTLIYVRLEADDSVRLQQPHFCARCSRLALSLGVAEWIFALSEGLAGYSSADYDRVAQLRW
jgi:hypothetical protein